MNLSQSEGRFTLSPTQGEEDKRKVILMPSSMGRTPLGSGQSATLPYEPYVRAGDFASSELFQLRLADGTHLWGDHDWLRPGEMALIMSRNRWRSRGLRQDLHIQTSSS